MRDIFEAISASDAIEKLKNVPAGAFAVKVVYKSALKLSSNAIKSGLNQADYYRLTTRLGRIKVNWYNTKTRKEMTAQGHIETHQPPKGFRGPENPEEEGLLYYRTTTNEPHLILQQGNVKNGVSVRYFVKGVETDFSKIENLYNTGILTKEAIKPVEDLPYLLLNLNKIEDLIVKDKENLEEAFESPKVFTLSVNFGYGVIKQGNKYKRAFEDATWFLEDEVEAEKNKAQKFFQTEVKLNQVDEDVVNTIVDNYKKGIQEPSELYPEHVLKTLAYTNTELNEATNELVTWFYNKYPNSKLVDVDNRDEPTKDILNSLYRYYKTNWFNDKVAEYGSEENPYSNNLKSFIDYIMTDLVNDKNGSLEIVDNDAEELNEARTLPGTSDPDELNVTSECPFDEDNFYTVTGLQTPSHNVGRPWIRYACIKPDGTPAVHVMGDGSNNEYRVYFNNKQDAIKFAEKFTSYSPAIADRAVWRAAKCKDKRLIEYDHPWVEYNDEYGHYYQPAHINQDTQSLGSRYHISTSRSAGTTKLDWRR